ncbi:MAG TPA: NPCBM/NEW2 domain-containing protein, partial [Candidatus Hydrogenedentes bacterium]|nr:NPCBM/NEW2 domain-containing protein [Candidatus Hydrogenedentota bacterium]
MRLSSSLFMGVAVLCAAAGAVSPGPDELATAARWARAKFAGDTALPPAPSLVVLENHNPVQKNGRFGKPLRIGETEHARGLYVHASSKVLVRLPGPAKTLTAVAGMDNNGDTAGGRGSGIFSVVAGGKALYTSGVLRGGDPGVPVSVDLAGAAEFTLEMGDAGDGIS